MKVSHVSEIRNETEIKSMSASGMIGIVMYLYIYIYKTVCLLMVELIRIVCVRFPHASILTTLISRPWHKLPTITARPHW